MSTVNDFPVSFDPPEIFADYLMIVRAPTGLPAPPGGERLQSMEYFFEYLGLQFHSRNPYASSVNGASGPVTPQSSLEIFDITANGNITLQNPSGSPIQGWVMRIRVTQDTTGGRTVAMGNKYRVPTSITVSWPTGANEAAILTMMYNQAADKWDVLSFEGPYAA